MLGKLFKHEFKSQSKAYGAIYLAVLLIGAVAFIFGLIKDKFPKNVVLGSLVTFAVTMAIMAVVAMFVMTLIYSVYRYYTNLIKDQGYLMHTLPVPSFNHHIVKLVMPILWFAADIVVTFIMIIFITRDLKFEWFDMVKDISVVMGFEVNVLNVISLVGYALVGVIASLSMFYACLNVGSLSNSNKGVMSFVAYLVFYMINQVISTIGLVIFMCVLVVKNNIDLDEMLASEQPPEGYFEGTMLTAIIISLVSIIIYSIISHHILTKRVNLE